MKRYFRYVIMGCLLVIVGIFTYLVINNRDIYIDSVIDNFIYSGINDKRTSYVKVITSLGSVMGIGITTLLLILFIKDKKIKMCIVGDLVGSTIINNLIKVIIRRPRPSNMLVSENGYSFPSGHSMASMVLYGYLIYLIYKYINNRWLKIIFITILSLVILLIGVSRIYLGVHYASDVICGFIIGFI